MQDKVSPHAAGLTTDHLNNNNVQRFPWLAKNSDINPIEQVWDAFKEFR